MTRSLWRPSALSVAALFCAALLASKIVSFGAADVLAARDPAAALLRDASHADALTLLAQRQLTAQRPELSAATRLVAVDPLAPGALSLYAAGLGRLGETARADHAMSVAAAHLPIDLIADTWLFKRALQSGDAAAALEALDTGLRARPYAAYESGGSAARLLALGPSAEEGFALRLAAAPPWREQLLESLALNAPDAAPLQRLQERLRASAAPPTQKETRALLERLVRDGRYDAAYLAWLNSLPAAKLSTLGLLYNGALTEPVSNLPFDWQIAPPRGSTALVVDDRGERRLALDFFGARVAFSHVRHLLALPPGAYVFSGESEARALVNDRGLRWRIFCVEDPAGALAVTPALQGSAQRSAFRVAFTVPAEACRAQMLLLEIPAQIESDWRISGSARYARLAVAPASP